MRQGFFHWYRSASTFYSHGMYMLKRRHFVFAADAFRESLRRRVHEGTNVSEPPTPTIFMSLGRACFLMGLVEKAVRYVVIH